MTRNFVFSPGKYLSMGFTMLAALVAVPVYSQPVPVISNLSPNSGIVGANITLSGTNFSATAASNVVYFGAVQAAVSSANPTSLLVTVPAGATFVPITVTVNGLTAHAGQPFMPTFPGNGQITNASLAARLDLDAGAGTSQVVFADLDGDGKSDLIIANASIGTVSLYRNISTTGSLTAGSFAARVDVPLLPSSGTSPYVIGAADLDGDGRLDIIAENADSNVISILRNISSPGSLTTNSFAARQDFSGGNAMRGLAVRDLNGDGRPEIVAANNGDNTISVFQNASTIGNIAFSARVNFIAGSGPLGVAIGDLDGDDKPDLAVANYNDNTISVLRNTGAGSNITTNSFAAKVDFPALSTVGSIAIGDMDGDGKLDLVTGAGSISGSQAISLYRNTATAGSITTSSFAARVDFAAGWVNTLALADLDGDGKLDIALASQGPSVFSIFKNISTPGSFTTASLAARVDYTAGFNPVGVAIGDLDGDGRPDIAFGNFYDGTISIYRNQTPLVVTPPTINSPVITGLVPNIGTPGTTITLSGTNFSASAASNIVYFGAVQAIVSSASQTNLWVTVPAGATFAPITVTVGGLTASSGQPFDPTFTGNGSNIITSSFAPSFNLPGANGPQSMVIADLDGDGKPDIAFVNGYNNFISIYRNISTNGALLGPASFVPRLDLNPSTNGVVGSSYRLHAVDLDGDGKLDLIVCDANSDHISIFHNIAAPGSLTTNSFEAPFTLSTSYDTRFATATDLDGDGRVDIVALNYGAKTISIYKNVGTTGALNTNSFAPAVSLAAPGGPYEAVIADLDGDGKPDLAVANSDSGTVAVYQNLATPGVIASNSFAPYFEISGGGGNTSTIIAVDLDGDGKLDLVTGSGTGDSVNVFRNLSGGGLLTTNSFAPRVDFGTPGWMHSVSVADFNGDGKPDLAVVGELNSYMAIFQNTSTPGTFTANSFAPRVDFGTGWNAWGIAVGDLEGDGRPDIVFGNYYDNTVQIYQNVAPFGTNTPPPPASLLVNGGFENPPGIYPYQVFSTEVAMPGWVVESGTVEINGTYWQAAEGTQSLDMNGIFDEIGTIYQDVPTVPGQNYKVRFAYAGNPECESPTLKTANAYWNGMLLANLSFDITGHSKTNMGWIYYEQVVTATSTNTRIRFQATSPTFCGLTLDDVSVTPTTAQPGCTVPPAGLVGWWKGDGSTLDSLAANNGVNQNVAFSNGVVDRAYAFDPENLAYGTYSGIQIADQPAYALTNSLTIEGWIRPRGDGYMIFWRGDQRPGLDPYSVSMQSSNTIFAICDAGGNSVFVEAPMNYFAWTHLAATLDGSSGTLSIYTNGVLAVQTNTTIRPFGSLQAGQSPGVGIGNVNDGANNFPFLGDIDEISLYNRALSAGEIQAIYGAGSLGKCVINLAPVILTQPTNQTVLAGGGTGFSVAATGAQPLSYQWNFNGTNISGATNATLTLTNIQVSQAGNYSVLVTNLYGTAPSSNAVLTVVVPAVPPTILSQTPSQVVLLGHPATFIVNVSGSDPLSYFWSRDGALIPGATNFSYTLNNAQLSDSGSKFSCLATNAYGFAASTNSTLKVIDSISNDLCSGAVVATGFIYTNLQSTAKATSFGDPLPGCVDGFGNGVWYQFTAPVNGVLIVDTFGSDFDTGLAIYTGACDALTEVTCNDDTGGVTSQVTLPTTAGTTYSILAGGYGAHTGNLVFHLNHLTPPAFVVQPADQSVVVTSNASFGATLTGALPMSFQWFFNGAPLVDDGRISGSTTASLTVSNITTADAGGYTLAATNFLGSASSAAAVLNVLVPPTISTQPIGRSVPPGLPTTFSAAATGNPAPSYYQWQLNGTNIPGATSANYTISAINTNHLGFYHLVASNSVGGTVSADAQLTFGPVAAWGRNLNNECLPPPDLSNVVAVAGTFGASFAVRTDGTVAAWGTGNATNLPASASNVVALATSASTGHYALRSDGRVVGWNGILPPPLSNIVAVAAGNNFGYGLRAEGTLTNWGSIPVPGFPAGLSQITAIACGYNNAIALRADGRIFVSGSSAVTNVPISATNVIAIAGGYTYAMALRADGKVIAWGSGTITNLPTSLTNIVAISAGNNSGENFGLAVRGSGKVVAWGDNGFGQTNPPAALTNLTSIAGAAAPFHGLVLVNDGSPVILHPPVGLTTFIGRDVTLHGDAVGAQPLSYQWLLNGTNIPGATSTSLVISNLQFAYAGSYQLFVSNSISTALSLAAPLTVVSNNTLTILSQTAVSATNVYQGGKFTVGSPTVLGNGPLRYQWFFSRTNNNYTVVVGATNDTLTMDPALVLHTGNYFVAVSNQFAGLTSAPVAVRVLFAKAWGTLAADPPGSLNVTNATAIAVGNAGTGSSLGHYLVLKSDGKISSWTLATQGFGETNFTALSNSIVTAIAAGYQDSLALKSDGTVFTAGYNVYGETNVPAGLNSVTAIACGDYHDLALKADGTITGWGQNTYLQTTNAAATNVVAIAASAQTSMALRADGSVVTWGFIGGQPPFNVTNIVAIACGVQHFLALRANGTVVGWGNNTYGQTTIAANLTNIVAIAAAANHSTLLRNDGTVVTLGAYNGQTTITAPADLANVIAIADGGDHDLALFGTRAPAFTVQPWNRAIPVNAVTNVILAAKCAGVQPMRYQWQLNGTNMPSATNDTLSLGGRLVTGAPIPVPPGTYQLIASNSYGIAISKPAKITAFYSLGEALDATNLSWITTSAAPWFGETNVTHDGVDAVRSGGIGTLQETILQTTVGTNWPGRYTFWWKVSSEQFFDTLEFRVNGTVQAGISGEVDWQQVSIPVASGTNVLQWRYSKDSSFDVGQDAAWLDQFTFLPDPPMITLQPVSQTVNMGTNVTFRVTAVGRPEYGLTYQWRRNGNVVGSGSVLTLNNVGRAQVGTYSVTVTEAKQPPGGSTISSNAVLNVLVPQLLGSAMLLPDGTFQLTSTDANGGLLSPSNLANFEAQASTNLVDWVTLPSALSLTNGMLQLQDAGQSNYNARYYRIIEH